MPLHRYDQAQLRALAYDPTGQAELTLALEELMTVLLLTIPSVTVVTVSNGDADPRVSVLATVKPGPVNSSNALRLRLPGCNGAVLTIFAREPGALNQLAADLPGLLDIHRRHAVLIADLHPPSVGTNSAATVAALDDASAVNRALGVLLDRGLPLTKGRTELLNLAEADRTSMASAARQVLAEIRSPADPDDKLPRSSDDPQPST